MRFIIFSDLDGTFLDHKTYSYGRLKSYIDKLLVVFPFEVNYFKKKSIIAEYVGNPLVELTANSHIENFNYNKPVIALLPGSRQQEIKSILPKMLEVVDAFLDHQFIIAAIKDLSDCYYKEITDKYSNVDIVFDQTYDLLNIAKAALVVSGTANLETSLFKTPQVVCYKTHWLNYLLAKYLLKIKYISLPNILLKKQIIPELIQSELNKKNLIHHLKILLNGDQDVESNYNQILNELGDRKTYLSVANSILRYF